MQVRGCRAWEQRLQKVKSLYTATFDSEVLTDQVSASLHSAGVASMEVFPMATLLALPIWMRVRK